MASKPLRPSGGEASASVRVPAVGPNEEPQGRTEPATVCPALTPALTSALGFGFGEKSVQQLLAAPFVAAEPADEPLFALALEADHEELVRSVERRRHDLERRHLRGMPHASLPVTVFDRSLEPFA